MRWVYWVVGVCLCSTWGIAQQLTDQFGAIKTKFVFTSNDEPLDIQQQFIIKAPNSIHSSTEGKSYGMGYESYWLEIETNTDIPYRSSRIRDLRSPFELYLYDGNNQLIGQIRLGNQKVKRVYQSARMDERREEQVRFYAFDLVDVPLILLNQTVRIEIMRYWI
jgi:hypothetical protein